MTTAERLGRGDGSVIGLIGAGHFLSHFFIFVLPPLLPLMKQEFGVSYAALGLAITLFNVASAVSQTPAGFLIDRFGARVPLLAGILLGAVAYAGMGLFPDYTALLFFAGLAGIANSVYHPADYTILATCVSNARMGRAFSLHTFAGYAGGAAAPLMMAFALELWDWKTGLMVTGLVGLATFALLFAGRGRLAQPKAAAGEGGAAEKTSDGGAGIRLLLSLPMLMCFAFFVLISMSAGGLQSFGVVAFIDLHGIDLQQSQMALTGYLVGSAGGILVGGFIADRTRHHERVAMAGFLATAVIVFAIGQGQWNGWSVIAAMSLGGVLFGMIMPSRDMLVRAITPEGQSGKVFGFVTTGFNVGGMLTPPLFGWIMDSGQPMWLFVLAPAFMIVAAGTVLATRAVQTERQPHAAMSAGGD